MFCDLVYMCDTGLVLGKRVSLKYVRPVLSKDVSHLCWVSDAHSVHCKVVKSLTLASPQSVDHPPELSRIAAAGSVQTGDQTLPVSIVIVEKAVNNMSSKNV